MQKTWEETTGVCPLAMSEYPHPGAFKHIHTVSVPLNRVTLALCLCLHESSMLMLCLTLETNEFRCYMYEAKIEESEKAGSCRESNPGHLWLELPVLCHWATTARQPPTLTILYISHTRQPLSMCHQNSVRGRQENSLCQKRTHAEWFTHSKCI